MGLIACPECGKKVLLNTPYCWNCGASIANSLVPCNHCEALISKSQSVCPFCKGEVVEQETKLSSQLNKDQRFNFLSKNFEASQKDANQNKASALKEWYVAVFLLFFFGGVSLTWYYYQMQKALKIEEQAYHQLLHSFNKTDFQTYLQNYPRSAYAEDVKMRLELIEKEEKHWQKVQEINTLATYQKYLKDYPEGIFVTPCQHIIDSLLWDKTIENNNLMALEKFIKNYPQSRFLEKAQALKQRYTTPQLLPEENDISLIKAFFNLVNKGKIEKSLAKYMEFPQEKFMGIEGATEAEVKAYLKSLHTNTYNKIFDIENSQFAISKLLIGNTLRYFVTIEPLSQKTTYRNGNFFVQNYKGYVYLNAAGKIQRLGIARVSN